MQKIIEILNEEQKRELINALYRVDDILEEASAEIGGEDNEYHCTDFYNGLYDLMYRLGQWC